MSDYAESLYQIGTGWLGWSDEATMRTSIHRIEIAYEGRMQLLEWQSPPFQDHEALGRVLGALGESRLANNLNQLARAANTGSLPVTPDTEQAIKDACASVQRIRAELLRALGVPSGKGA